MFIKFNEMFRANGTELCVVMLWLKGEYRRFWCANIFLYLSQSVVKGQRIICKEFLSAIHITTDHLICLFSKSRVLALTFHYVLSPNKFISCWFKAVIFVIWRKFDQYLSNCWCQKFKRGTLYSEIFSLRAGKAYKFQAKLIFPGPGEPTLRRAVHYPCQLFLLIAVLQEGEGFGARTFLASYTSRIQNLEKANTDKQELP